MQNRMENKMSIFGLRILSAVLCGGAQWLYGKRARAAALFLWFWLSFAVSWYFLAVVKGDIEYIVGISALGALVAGWVYAQMDINDIIAEGKEGITANPVSLDEMITLSEEEENDSAVKEEISVKKIEADEWYRKGRIFYLRGELALAKDCFEKAIKLYKKDGDSIFQLARVYFELGNLKKAVSLFKQYLELKTSDKKWRAEAQAYLVKIKQ